MQGFIVRRPFLLLCLLIFVIGFGLTALFTVTRVMPVKASETDDPALIKPLPIKLSSPITSPIIVATDALTSSVFLPLIANHYTQLAMRMGYDAIQAPIMRYPELTTLRAGWYIDWFVQVAPERPDGIEHVQVIRVHQKLTCGQFQNGDRTGCPYTQPLDYLFSPAQATIAAAAKASPGALWVIGNEMDRVDWRYCAVTTNPCPAEQIQQAGQDEILPETYAHAYHDLYEIIKNVDPTARVANGGVIQATPLRLQYLTIVWDTYRLCMAPICQLTFGMCIILSCAKKKNEYGADMPPGLPNSPTIGEYTTSDWTHIDHDIFNQQIRAFRQWMKEHGQQEKPLIVSEYGMLYHHCVEANRTGVCVKDLNNKQVALDFMTWTFDYFLNTRDCTLGLATDDCHLVQRWTWFGLDIVGTDDAGNPTFGQNEHTSLFNSTTLQITDAGRLFAQFVGNHLADLAK